MAKNNALLLALAGGGAYLAYKSGILKSILGTGNITPPTGEPTGTAVGNVNAAPPPVDDRPVGGHLPGEPRGIRNNNPGNVVYNTANNWKGQVGTDGTFAKFSDGVYGLRAAGIVLRNYCKLYGLCTISGIISRWAPAPVNNPASYAAQVSKLTGIPVNAQLNMDDIGTIVLLLRGITTVENGSQYWSYFPEDYMQAAARDVIAYFNG